MDAIPPLHTGLVHCLGGSTIGKVGDEPTGFWAGGYTRLLVVEKDSMYIS
jgi:hypothetical protein